MLEYWAYVIASEAKQSNSYLYEWIALSQAPRNDGGVI